MLAAEAELARQVLADDIPVKQRHPPVPALAQHRDKCSRERGLASAGKPGEQDGEALEVARRIGAPKLGRNFGEGEPLRDLKPERKPAPEPGATQPEHPALVREPIDGKVAGLVLHVDDLQERHHGDAELFLVLGHKRLRLVGAIERPTIAIRAGGGVVASDDEMRAPVVPADDRGCCHGNWLVSAAGGE